MIFGIRDLNSNSKGIVDLGQLGHTSIKLGFKNFEIQIKRRLCFLISENRISHPHKMAFGNSSETMITKIKELKLINTKEMFVMDDYIPHFLMRFL